MDAGVVAAVLMLIVWALGTVLAEPPGWFHAFLTLGVFLLIVRIVAIGTRKKSG